MSNGRCTECGRHGIPILYGLPATHARVLAAAGLLRLGGCVVTDDDPNWVCPSCAHMWSDPEGALRELYLLFGRARHAMPRSS
ncbi:hypothetical protein [Nocardia bhagyanarayanae]|uniref:Uncharacterized protein n=1 Tax=Nocardia bhagyanarayanae TaxID=1215925 RepID=A0A543F962_9NOCA|nr:hypothetical protein [Nocardia bhagyanarayanae]TQM30362.1 hypothetical protein FB390_1986 [Nocardia bhagyanarayanae]